MSYDQWKTTAPEDERTWRSNNPPNCGDYYERMHCDGCGDYLRCDPCRLCEECHPVSDLDPAEIAADSDCED